MGHLPDVSANVLSVGGTSLTLDPAGNYGSETGWAGSGGGLSLYERLPGYQLRAVPKGVRRRAVPDVAIVANKYTGVQVYDLVHGGWTIGGGTSLAAPLWAGVIAIADQGRAAAVLVRLMDRRRLCPIFTAFPDVTSMPSPSETTVIGHIGATI